jgi:hypothetical protein
MIPHSTKEYNLGLEQNNKSQNEHLNIIWAILIGWCGNMKLIVLK